MKRLLSVCTFIIISSILVETAPSEDQRSGYGLSMQNQMEQLRKSQEMMRGNFRANIEEQDRDINSKIETQWEELQERVIREREKLRRRVQKR